MSRPVAPTYRLGTHRLVAPEETLSRLSPHLAGLGITRCADVTRLDVDLGMPVYMAVRPRGRVLQSSAGKGLTPAAARVSALMEAVELDVAERPAPGRLRWASRDELLAEGHEVDPLREMIDASGRYFGDRFRIPWTPAEDLLRGGAVWVPAGAVYFCEPTPCRTSTNGLASGNHLLEATLHALYELIERDALAGLIDGERLATSRLCRGIDPTSVEEPHLAAAIEKIRRSDTKVVLLEVLSGIAVPTYWCVLLNRRPFANVSALNTGSGAHLDAGVAMCRAIGEAVQSRLTMIHGSRDDIVEKPVYADRDRDRRGGPSGPAFRHFDALALTARAAGAPYLGDFEEATSTALSLLERAGHRRIYRVTLDCPVPSSSVVKVLVPTLRWRRELL